MTETKDIESQQGLRSGKTAQRKPRTSAWWAPRILAALVLLAILAFGGLVLLIYAEARSDQTGPVDAIVVLGAAQFNGVPSQVFQARLDTAFELFQAGAADTIIVSGGKLPGDVFTEAESGRDYLVSRGVPAEAIVMEHLSSNTSQSMNRVAEIMQTRGQSSVLLVSDGFHLYRAKMLAEERGLSVQTNDADDSPIRQGSSTEFRYVLREAFAVAAHLTGVN